MGKGAVPVKQNPVSALFRRGPTFALGPAWACSCAAPLASGRFLHVLAQCPTWPHLAHLLRDFSFSFDHFFGGAVRRGPFLNFFLGPSGAAFLGGPLRLGAGPRLLGRPWRLGVLPRGEALTL